MKIRSKQIWAAAVGAFSAGLCGLMLVKPAKSQQAQQLPPPTPGITAGQYFKNVTTSTLKTLSPSDFMGAMGVMNAAVGYDCSNCHPGAGTDAADFVTDKDPHKLMARRMVEMVAAINKNFFGGAQRVTCWTCHHGLEQPTTSITLDKLYGEPPDEKGDILPAQPGVSATLIFDQYVQAAGGAQKLAGLKSYIATGKSIGYGGVGGAGEFQIYAQAPDLRAMWIHFPQFPERGISAWTFDGKVGWISQPRAIMPLYELAGNDLAGAKLDGIVSFPAEIKTAFPTWRVAADDTINGHDVSVLQGNGPGGGVIGTFYFDKQTHLLTRFVRRTPSPVGRITIQQDFEDYRDVDGIKFPFKYSFLWLDGRFTAEISDVKINVPIEAAKFSKP